MPIFHPTTLTTDDLWFAPALACAVPPSRSRDDEDTSDPDRDDADAAPMVPKRPRSVALAGHGQDERDPPGTLRATKRRGGGSWLLGSLALLEDAPPPGLASASDDDSSASSSLSSGAGGRRVSFDATVAVRRIPRASELSPAQRRRMYASRAEVRRERARNRKEFRYDGYDWRAATEEEGMWQVDAVTGEAVHPAHYDYHCN